MTPELGIESLALQCHQLWRKEIVGKVFFFPFTIIKFFREEIGKAKIWSNKDLLLLLGLNEMIYFLHVVTWSPGNGLQNWGKYIVTTLKTECLSTPWSLMIFFLNNTLNWPDIFFIRVRFPCHSDHSFSIQVEMVGKQFMAVLLGIRTDHTKTSPLQTVPISLQNGLAVSGCYCREKVGLRVHVIFFSFPNFLFRKISEVQNPSKNGIINIHMSPLGLKNINILPLLKYICCTVWR